MLAPREGRVASDAAKWATYDNRTLELAFSTIDALRRDPQIGKFVRFIRKQDPAAAFRSVTAKTHPSRRKRR